MHTFPAILPIIYAHFPKTLYLLELLSSQGKEARLVGGCVRDALLRLPIKDIDIATPLLPEEVMECCKQAGLTVKPTGIEHGTVMVVLEGYGYEITTLREDVSCDGRYATVAFTSAWEKDAARRDFTINALSCSREGKIYDYFSGLEDLEKRLVRFVGAASERIQEDYLRILRYFRFAACYSAPPYNQEALAACAAYASHVAGLSAERISSEMRKLLAASSPLAALSAMHDLDVLKWIMPTKNLALGPLSALLDIEQKLHIIPDSLRRLAALFMENAHAIKEAAMQEISEGWKLSKRERDTLKALVSMSPLPFDLSVPKQQQLLRQCTPQLFKEVVLLSWAEARHRQGVVVTEDVAYQAMLHLAGHWEIPVFPVKGRDLKEQGIYQGVEIGMLLRHGENWWEENHYHPDKKAILKEMLRYYSENI